jgi:hypothetical protein
MWEAPLEVWRRLNEKPANCEDDFDITGFLRYAQDDKPVKAQLQILR